MKYSLRSIARVVLFGPLLGSGPALWAQASVVPPLSTQLTASLSPTLPVADHRVDVEVSGQVVDEEDGVGLPGVNVVAKGTTIGTVTDVEGNYRLSVPDNTTTLVFSSVGYLTQEVPVNGQSTLDVSMGADVQSLSEVVVVGYGTQKKVTATGAVNTVKGEVVKQSPATNITNNLVGRLPGVTALSGGGEPGNDNSFIRIRGINTLGDNSPLVVIDGIVNRTGGIGRMNPNDIESITVLKDASAAIYGSQAANGVLLVTTKRGEVGKPTISFNYNQGVNQPARLPQMADAATYATMLNEIDAYRDRTPRFSDEEIQTFGDGSDPWNYPNTDWFDAVIKPLSLQSQANLSVNGGSEQIRYFLSIGYTGEDGFYENSATRFDQYQFRANVDADVSDYINLQFGVLGRQEDRNFPTRSAGNIFRALMRGKPNLPAYWPNGLPGPDIEYGDNPVVTGTDATGYDLNKQYFLQTNLRLNAELPWIEGMSFTANAAFDKDMMFRKLWQTPWYLYTWDYATYDDAGDPLLVRSKRGLDDPQLTQISVDGQRITLNAYANYEKEIGLHFFNVMAGLERQTYRGDYFNAFRRFFISDRVDQLFAGGEDQRNNNGSATQTARLNYFGRVNYNFQEKYLAEFVWRYDGSYIFPEDKRYGFFPGVSLGWRISEEDFWKNNISFLDNFKIRGSWGQTGNDRIDEYQFLSTYAFSDLGYVFGVDQINKTIQSTRVPNPDVTWEVANQFNVGIEGQLLEGKISFELDYFNYRRDNILWFRNASVPGTTGLVLPRENIGEIANRGVDGIVTFIQNFGDFQLDLSVNGSYAKNEILFWDESPGVPEWQQSTGHPMFTNLYYNAIGVFEDEAAVNAYPHWQDARPGDIIFEDVNEDGVIDGQDRIRVDENIVPRFTGGISIGAAYKNFNLTVLFQGATGASQYVFTESGEIGNFLQEYADQRWTPENPNGQHPRTFNRRDEYWVSQPNTYFLRDADYVRLKNVELGYSFPTSFNEKLGIQQLRLYVNGFNLFTLDKLKVLDPEGSPSVSGANELNFNQPNSVDYANIEQSGQYYPQKRVFNAGVSLTF